MGTDDPEKRLKDLEDDIAGIDPPETADEDSKKRRVLRDFLKHTRDLINKSKGQ